MTRSIPQRIGVTVLALTVATVARALLSPILPDGIPFITYFPAVAVAAWYGGRWAGIGAVAAGYVIADLMFIPPIGALALFYAGPTAVSQFALLVLMSGIVIGLTDGLQRANERALKKHRSRRVHMPRSK